MVMDHNRVKELNSYRCCDFLRVPHTWVSDWLVSHVCWSDIYPDVCYTLKLSLNVYAIEGITGLLRL